MSAIEKLTYATAIDATGWFAGIEAGRKGLEDFHRDAAGSLEGVSLGTPKLETGGSAQKTASSMAPAGGMMGGGMMAAGMIAALQDVKSAVKDAGATIAKQLDAQLKFTKLKGSIDEIARYWSGDLDKMGDKAASFRRHVQAVFGEGFLKVKIPKIPRVNLPNFSAGAHGVKAFAGAMGVASTAARGMGFALTAGLGPAGLLFEAFAMARGAFEWFVGGAKSASNLNETISKTDVILGGASGKVKAFAEDMASKFGLVKGVTLDTAASFAGLGKSLGRMSGDKLAGFANEFTKLSADLSSFSNIDMSAAGDAIRTGLSGNQSDTLKELGVVLTEETTKQYAYAKGIAAAGSALNEQQKFMARSGLIAQGLSKASGDLERTQGGAANQARKLGGNLTNIATAIGTAVLPAITEGLLLLNEFTTWATKAFNDNKSVIDGWASGVVEGFDWVIAAVHNLPAAFEVARLSALEKLMQIGDVLATLGPNAALVAEYIASNWTRLIADAFNATLTGLQNLWANWRKIGTAIGEWFANPTAGFKVDWTPLLDGFKATADKFPDLIRPTLTDMSREIGAAAAPIRGEVNARRAARAGGHAAAALADDEPMADEEAKETKKKKKGGKDGDKAAGGPILAGALELGSKEAYSSLANAMAGKTGKADVLEKSGRETSKNTAMIAKLLADEKRGKIGGDKKPQRMMI